MPVAHALVNFLATLSWSTNELAFTFGEALGGELRVVSPPGRGTVLTAEIPCGAAS